MELASDTLLRMLRQQGDETGMRAACQNLIDSGYDQLALKVMFNLGTLLEEHGDVVGAKAAVARPVTIMITPRSAAADTPCGQAGSLGPGGSPSLTAARRGAGMQSGPGSRFRVATHLFAVGNEPRT